MSTDLHPVLDHGFVRLDACMATDLAVVNAARVSFGKRKTEMGDDDVGLIRFLMRERHTSPFEHAVFRFHVRAPIFVAREWMRHRAASYNEYSLRYAEAIDEFYVPAAEDVRTQVGKPGAYTFEPVSLALSENFQNTARDVYERSFQLYREMVDAGVARELARIVLPVGIYTEFYWTVNCWNLLHFIDLRAAPTAQREIQVYAKACDFFLEQAMPVTHAAWWASRG